MKQAIDSTPVDEPGELAAANTYLGALFGGRYRAVEVLKQRPQGETLRAVDRQSGREVVVTLVPARIVSAARGCDWSTKLRCCGNWPAPVSAPCWTWVGPETACTWFATFVPGASLQARLRRGPLALADALTVGRCLLSALERDARRRHLAPRHSPRQHHRR